MDFANSAMEMSKPTTNPVGVNLIHLGVRPLAALHSYRLFPVPEGIEFVTDHLPTDLLSLFKVPSSY